MARKSTYEELEQKVEALEKELASDRRLEGVLRESEDMFWKAFRSSPAAMVITTLADGKIMYINDSFTRSTGYSNEEALGRTLIEMGFWLTPEERSHVTEKLRKDGSVQDLEFKFRDKAGGTRLGLISREIVMIEGEPCIITAMEDITKHKRAEETLRESERTIRGLLDASPDFVALMDPEGILLEVNEAMAQRFGRKKDALVGLDVWNLLSPDIAKHRKSYFDQAIQKGKPIRLEDERKSIWFDNICFPVFDDQGKVIKIGLVARDITERKQAEEMLRESEAKYKALVESSIDGIVVAQGKEIRFANPAMIEMFGCADPDELVGHSFTEFISPEYRQLMVERGLAREKGEIVPSRYEYKALQKDGTAFDAEISVKKIVYAGKSARQGVIRNISSQKQAEKELKRKIVELDSFINNIPDMAWVKDVDSRFVLANKAFAKAVGMAPDAIANQTCEVCFGKQAANKFREDDLNVMKRGRQTVVEEKITNSQKKEVWLETIKSPILDGSGGIIGTVGVARDITKRKQTEEALQKAHDTLEKQVEKRTLELQDANERLERVNTGLQVLMEHRQDEMRQIQENIVENANKLITPYIEKMDNKRMSAKNSAYLEVIASGLKELVSPFVNTLSSKEVVLSPTEVRVADLIRQGNTSKEIASLMNVSANAITVHRYNIRRKLGLLNKKVNLRSYLQSLPT